MIHNHYAAKLSDLDMQMVKCIPPGGNWKDIPKKIPSRRLDQIRKSFLEGKGSRSTYYGRLMSNMPSYTISTYFNRPGNGCFIHYDIKNNQNRVISQREAARLQTFPDNFVFNGSKTSINKQIGNAVPPVLSFQIAKCLGKPGLVVDLFTGAGGLSLGFHWAGWKSIIANDIDPVFLQTYQRNIGGDIIVGDIKDKEIFNHIVKKATEAKRANVKMPFIVIGGPPCQGFSTAGNKRSMQDQRNHLFKNYKKIIDAIQPDAFVFENVAGLLNIEGGAVFKLITNTLKKSFHDIKILKLKAEEYGVPQRRTRIVLIGHKKGFKLHDLKAITLKKHITCENALNDLPSILSAEDGSLKNYNKKAENPFQKLMRGEIKIDEYLKLIAC